MASLVARLAKRRLITPPDWLPDNVAYETMMGSQAYGVSQDSSDIDVYGFCLPPKTIVFPHLAGEIPGFGKPGPRFDQFEQHRIADGGGDKARLYDVVIYSIVKYFTLLAENNPNIIDSVFTPDNCVLSCTPVGTLVRENRRLFLHKGAWPKFKGYAYAQLHKMKTKEPIGKRKETIATHGYDVKFAYHLVRLLYEVEMILREGDIDLIRNREHLKAIRRGDVPEQDIHDWAAAKEKQLEAALAESKLPERADEEKLRALLLQCLEMHYGSLEVVLSAAIARENPALQALREIADVVEKNRPLLS